MLRFEQLDVFGNWVPVELAPEPLTDDDLISIFDEDGDEADLKDVDYPDVDVAFCKEFANEHVDFNDENDYFKVLDLKQFVESGELTSDEYEYILEHYFDLLG